MEYIRLGKLTNTHGIKGEVRILSDFEKKSIVFVIGFNLYIGNNKIKMTINSYRPHKEYDMVTFKGFNDINQVEQYKGMDVYILRSDLELQEDEYLLHDLIGFSIFEDNSYLGKVKDIVYNNKQILLQIEYNKNYYIPFVEEFIVKVDLKNQMVITKKAGELII